MEPNSFGVTRGEQPLVRASRASKVAGAFLVLFWHAKENLTSRNRALPPRHKRENHFWFSFGAQKRTKPYRKNDLTRAQARKQALSTLYISRGIKQWNFFWMY